MAPFASSCHPPPPPSLLLLSLLSLFLVQYSSALPRHLITRRLFLVQQQPLVLQDHKGPLLKGDYAVHLLFYGRFTSAQRAIVTDFVRSLSQPKPNATSPPSVASWWDTVALYRGGPSRLSLGRVVLDGRYSLGKSLTDANLQSLAAKAAPHKNAIVVVITSDDVLVDGFCMNRCGFHDDGPAGKHGRSRFTYLWVGNSAAQCPGECAWPFHKPYYGPPTPPLTPPNGDVGMDGVVINLATLLAGTVTNPYGSGYYQGPATLPMEAVTACTGIFGAGAYPGYPGQVLVDPKTRASYNAKGLAGREYLLPAMWDPKLLQCKALV